MSLSLVAVFLPILLMGGVPGRLFREFGVTLSAAVLVSLLVSLTTTPMLCARWLGKDEKRHGRTYHAIGSALDWLQRLYLSSLTWALRHGRIMLLLLLATIGLNVYLYGAIDKGFFPTQDGGRLLGEIQTDQNTSFQTLQKQFGQIVDILLKDPAVANVAGFAGSSQSANSARIFITLKPHEQRDGIEIVMDRLRKAAGRIPGANLHMFPAQELRIGGRMSFGLIDYTLQSDDLELLRQWTPKVQAAFAKLPELSDVNSSQQDKGEQIGLTVNRDLAARYGVSRV